jgi:hypothetical protein
VFAIRCGLAYLGCVMWRDTMQLSKNFSLPEMVKSQAAIRLGLKNEPGPEEIANLKALCVFILQPLRDRFGPITVTSGFRSHGINRMIGGARNSQHVLGQAADIEAPSMSTYALANAVMNMGLPFDQLILEFYESGVPDSGWVHVSYRPKGRREVLTAAREGNKTVYTKGLIER